MGQIEDFFPRDVFLMCVALYGCSRSALPDNSVFVLLLLCVYWLLTKHL